MGQRTWYKTPGVYFERYCTRLARVSFFVTNCVVPDPIKLAYFRSFVIVFTVPSFGKRCRDAYRTIDV